ncbi:dATP/dGTP diphosphohydrolase domain-containing protein, partial [Mesorhizobium sp. M7A.F.Ca.MR.362.00.0.0]|uniref:dATP/dGTP diphosphohydrolase domain-containing protein n=1 Tax=Mesorhizobium sp. M7A.F.Ca.MR.362.00.0.0 TaxID=2496779 RepID=UPI000FD414B1
MAKPTNPKAIFGDKKPPLGYIPLSAQLAELEALYDGMLKYEPLNWRETMVEAMTYVEAAMRHLQLWKVGEELTRDTLVKNLGAVKACCTILIDAAAHGTLIDNRPKSPVEADLLYEGEEWVERLKEVHQERLRQRQQAATAAPVNTAEPGVPIPIVDGHW